MSSNLFDPVIQKIFQQDKKLLETTQLPIITVSATFKEDLKRFHGFPNNETSPDIVFSRAHYSMAIGLAVSQWKTAILPDKAWIVDPTNYVSSQNLKSIAFTELVGKTIARNKGLQVLKKIIDTFGRSKLPIVDSITPPLLYVSANVSRPIVSFHIAAGNVLLSQGKTVIQVVTDPHVRDEYVLHSHLPNSYYFVFDENTKIEFLEKAMINNRTVDSKRVIVTGPPIDPRIVDLHKKKVPWRSGTIKLCIATGGLGTNKQEILDILGQLLPAMKERKLDIKILLYAGTHQDIYEATKKLASEHQVFPGKINDQDSDFRIIYHPQIVDANEQLIIYGFPWADGFITKPSGDMAYDAVAAGCFLLTLAEWGEWEVRIKHIFTNLGVARVTQIDNIVDQLFVLKNASGKSQSWIETAMQKTHHISPLFRNGVQNMVMEYQKISKLKTRLKTG